MFNGKRIWISGGTGSWGQELTSQLLSKYNPAEIIIFSRNEFNQVQMKRKFDKVIEHIAHKRYKYVNKFSDNEKKEPMIMSKALLPEIKYVIGDVRDYDRVNESMRGVDYVFHLAALKHVPICEENMDESIKTNITGAQNIIKASIYNGVKKVIDVSTDKACSPLNFYGACKSVGEKLFINANNLRIPTKFVCIRAGNVIGSNGSVIPFFIEKAKSKDQFPITSYEMTRYLFTLSDAIELVLVAFENGIGGEIFVTNMPAAKILDVAQVINNYYNAGEIIYKDLFPQVGIRPGEKLHEMLVSEYESAYTFELDKRFKVILPMNGSLHKFYTKKEPMKEASYTSDQKLMDHDEIRKLLLRSGFLR